MDALLWDHSINEDAKEVPQGLKSEEEISRFTVSMQPHLLCWFFPPDFRTGDQSQAYADHRSKKT
jgi:hypothetical protein